MNDLLICAKAVGLEVAENFDFMPKDNVVYVGDCSNTALGSKCIQYNPLTNDAQAFELLKVLSEKDIDIRIYGAERVELVNHGTERLWHAGGQTLNEAIIKAVVAMEDTHE